MLHKTKIQQYSWLEQPAILLFLFTILILLTRIFLRGQILELDEAEQVIWAQKLLPGYPDQPPLYSWLQYGFFQVFGFHLMSIALLKSSLLFGCFYCFHQVCRLHCQTITLAWCATLAWALISAISLDLIKDNTHSVLALFSACLTWYWFIAPSRMSNLAWYFILGCVMGIGFLSKFNYLLFLFIVFISALSLQDYRRKLLNPGMLLTLSVGFIIASPYILWLLEHSNVGLGSSYKLAPPYKQHSHGITELVKALLFFALPCLLFTRIFFPISKGLSQQNPQNSLLIRYHQIVIPILVMVTLGAGMRNFETRWLIPILFLFPTLYFSQVNTKIELSRRIKLFLTLCLLIQFSMFIALVHRGHNEHNKHNQFPFKQVIELIKKEPYPIDYILTDSHWFLGNLMMGLPFNNGKLVYTPLRLPKGNSLLIWQSSTQPNWVTYFAKSQALGEIKLIRDQLSQEVIAGYVYTSRQG